MTGEQLQAAIDARALPPGLYEVPAGVVLAWTGDLDLTGVTLRALGPGRVLQSLGGQGPCSLTGVRILGGGGDTQAHAVSIHDATEATVRDVVAEGVGGDVVYIGARVGSALVEDVDGTTVGRGVVVTTCPAAVVRRVRGAGCVSVVRCERGTVAGALSVLVEDVEGDGNVTASGWGAGGHPLPLAVLRGCRVPELVLGGVSAVEMVACRIGRVRISGRYVGMVTYRGSTLPITIG